jgi:hypothetical protein
MEYTMRTILVLSIFIGALFPNSSLLGNVQSNMMDDSLANNPPTISENMRKFLMIDIAGYPLNRTHSGSWQPTQSFRLGYGRNLVYPLELRMYAEYYEFSFDIHDGLAYQDYSYGRRRDFAIYPAIVAFEIVEFAFGGYYTIQDEVIHRSIFSSLASIDPVVKGFKLYLHVGVGGTIHLIGPLSCSLGLVSRNIMQEGNRYFGVRAGLKFEI